MKNISNIILIFLSLSLGLIFSCASHNIHVRPAVAEDKRTAGEANFDALDFPGDEDIITTGVPAAVDSQEISPNIGLGPQASSDEHKALPVFAVQVFASKSSTEARDFKISIASLFSEEIRVDYQAPYYKVTIGNAVGLDDAEALLKKVKDQGYPEAWLVRRR